MKKRLMNNAGLKLASLLLALILWFLVAQIDDPQVTVPFENVPVKLVNTELFTEQNKVYEILDNTDRVKVTIKAPKSVLQKIRFTDIYAVADVSKLTDIKTIPISYTVQNMEDGSIKNIKGDHESVQLSIEDRVTKWVRVTPQTTGEVMEGYTIGDISLDQTMIEVSGPQSVVEKVSSAVISIDVGGANSMMSLNVEPQLMNREGNPVYSQTVTQNVSYVHVDVSILATKEIPFRYTVTGTPKEGYLATGEVVLSQESVKLAGAASTLAGIKVIDIPLEYTDITDKSETFESTYSLRDYMKAANLRLADNSATGSVTVTVYLEKMVEKDVRITPGMIQIENVPEGFTAFIENADSQYVLKITGLNKDITLAVANGITGKIDIRDWMEKQKLTELKPGEHEIQGEFSLPEELEILSVPQFKVRIEETEQDGIS